MYWLNMPGSQWVFRDSIGLQLLQLLHCFFSIVAASAIVVFFATVAIAALAVLYQTVDIASIVVFIAIVAIWGKFTAVLCQERTSGLK